MKFSHFKAAILAASAIMGAAPIAGAFTPVNTLAQEVTVDAAASAGGVSATSNTAVTVAASVKNGFVKEGNSWFYYKNNKKSTETTIINGTINGVHAWYYIVKGKADLNYTGFAKNSNGWWYVEKGKVTFKKNDVIQGTVNGKNGWWNVKGSKVIFNTTIENNRNGWWYIKDGKVDFNYTGFAKNSNGWWYVENGKVTFKKNDVIQGKVNGQSGWWNVKGSKVVFNTTIENNKNGWWYIKNGKVDFSYTGFAKNYNGNWYIEKGKVIFNKNGVVSGTVNGKTSKWNVKNGKVVSEAVSTSTSNSTAGWKTGKASAYGGSTDPGCGTITANGSRVTNSSMGVAIPLAWGRRDLLGHKVEIQYNGKTVTATINDLGGMGGGSRALDLQPGVFKSFGFNSCRAWGVRTVKYRIL